MSGPTPPPIHLVPGQQPTQEQIAQIQAHMRADAQRLGMSMEQYIEKLREQAAAQQAQMDAQQQQQQQQHQHQHSHENQNGSVQGVQPGTQPKPEAIVLAKFLRAQELKPRTCIFQEKRKDIFRVKRAIRALQSPAYEKLQAKNAILPKVTDRATAENAFKMLPLSLLALRVEKVDPEEEHEGHSHGKTKRIKGLWTVRIVQHQDAEDDMYYMWLYEGSQWRQKAYAIAALAGVMTLVMFPLWPLVLRQGAWYLSMGFFGLIALFFVMSIFRLILFCITMFSHPPGLWLFPNLFEDVGFFDSFRPTWAWQEDKKATKAKKTQARLEKAASKEAKAAKHGTSVEKATGTEANDASSSGTVEKRHMHARVEEADDE